MHSCYDARLCCWAALLVFSWLTFGACSEKKAESDLTFFKRQDAANNGDYLATYPLHNPDSCILRLKAEVPVHLQPWGCLSLWYHLPRTSPTVSFRLLELYDQNYPHDTVFAFTQMVRGEFLVELDKYDSARIVLADARSRYLRLHRPLDASDADYLMARCYNKENNTAQALESYFRVLDLINSHNTTFSHRHAFLYVDIAAAYLSRKDYPKELFWLKKGWNSDTSKIEDGWKYKVRFAQRLSSNYAKTQLFDSSLVMAQLAANIFRAHSKASLPAELSYQLGFAYFKRKDCAAALPLLLDASRLKTNSPNNFMKCQIEQFLGASYLCLGRLDSAEIYFRKALATPDTNNLIGCYQQLAQIHAQQGMFKMAYEEEKESNNLAKRAYDSERVTALAEFEARYQATQKEHRISELEAAHQLAGLQNKMIALVFLLAGSFALSLFFRQRSRRRILEQQNELLTQDKKLLAQEKELAEAREILKNQELEHSKRILKNTQEELHTTTSLLALKDSLIEELELRRHQDYLALKDSLDASPNTAEIGFRRMKILTDTDWSRFQEVFEQNFPGLMFRLKERFPDMTSAEKRLFFLYKLKFSHQEISETLGISLQSVYRSRYRLKAKVKLSEAMDLDLFVSQFN